MPNAAKRHSTCDFSRVELTDVTGCASSGVPLCFRFGPGQGPVALQSPVTAGWNTRNRCLRDRPSCANYRDQIHRADRVSELLQAIADTLCLPASAERTSPRLRAPRCGAANGFISAAPIFLKGLIPGRMQRRVSVYLSRGRRDLERDHTGVDVTAVYVHVEVEGGDPLGLDAAVRQLRQELLRLDIDDAVIPDSATPLNSGAKGIPVDGGTLLVGMANSAVLVSVFQLIGNWLGRGEGRRRVTIRDGERSLEVTAVSRAQAQQIIEAFFADTASTAGEKQGEAHHGGSAGQSRNVSEPPCDDHDSRTQAGAWTHRLSGLLHRRGKGA